MTASVPRLRLNSGGLYALVPELAAHDPADPARALSALLGPPREVADGVVLVSRYADCQAILRDDRFRRALRNAPAFEGQGTSFLTGLDPPEHTRTRRLLGAAFTPRIVEHLRPAIEDLVHTHLDAFGDAATIDLAAGLSRPVPLAALCALIGIPVEDAPLVSKWSEPISDSADLLAAPRTREQQTVYRDTLREFRPYLRELLTARRAAPADDLLSRLAVGTAEDDRLTDREIIANIMGLLVVGHETTVSTIGHGLLAALLNPQWWQELATGGDEFAGRFTEETLRIDCPVQATPRVAGEDLDLDGMSVDRGTSLILLLGVANRDPAVFPDPHQFDPSRPASVRHLALGTGLHYCVGAGLGRLEASIALQAAAQRLIAPRLEPGGVSYAPGWGLRVPHRIEIRVDGVRAAQELG